MLIWCPAIARAWRALAPTSSRTLAVAVLTPSADDMCAARLIQQASFLHLSLLGRASMPWGAAAGWLARACSPSNYRCWEELDAGGDQDDEGDEPPIGEPRGLWDPPVWEASADQDCPECYGAATVGGVRAGARPDLLCQTAWPAGGLWLQMPPRGRPLAALCWDAASCLWPIGTRHWWPTTGRAGHCLGPLDPVGMRPLQTP